MINIYFFLLKKIYIILINIIITLTNINGCVISLPINIFNINPISIERIDFTKKKGNVKGTDLDNISKAFLDSDLFKYLPSKNNP